MGAGAVWAMSLQELAARGAHRGPVVINGVSPYGPIRPQKDEATGLELLKLPEGFRYWSYSWTGDMMSDGVPCPNLHDGMAVVDFLPSGDDDDDDDQGQNGNRSTQSRTSSQRSGNDDNGLHGGKKGQIVLVRNHEGDVGPLYITSRPDITYAPAGVPTG